MKGSIGPGSSLPRITKAETRRCEAFDAAVEQLVLSLGGKVVERSAPPLPRVRMSLETKAGELSVAPYGTWIACRFADVERAKTHLDWWPRSETGPLNGFSGKWNFIYPAAERGENIRSFSNEVRKLL